MSDSPTLVAIMGPTASGKTGLAEALADHLGWQLINADAFQVYRGLDIGTAKSPRKGEYALIDILEPQEPFGAGAWIERCVSVLDTLYREGRSAILVGGTLYYVRALMEGYTELYGPPDPELRAELNQRTLPDLLAELDRRAPNANVDRNNRVRVQRALEKLAASPQTFTLPHFRKVKLGLERTGPERILQRVEDMVKSGWLDEVISLRERGVSRDDPGMRAHGYRAMWDVVEGRLPLASAIVQTAIEVNQYAKRQRTWLRREPNLVKLPSQDERSALATALAFLQGGNDGKID